MEEAFRLLVPGILSVLAALAAYLKIKAERTKTKDERDGITAGLEHRLTKLETEVSALQDLRNTVDRMNETLQRLVGLFEAKFK